MLLFFFLSLFTCSCSYPAKSIVTGPAFCHADLRWVLFLWWAQAVFGFIVCDRRSALAVGACLAPPVWQRSGVGFLMYTACVGNCFWTRNVVPPQSVMVNSYKRSSCVSCRYPRFTAFSGNTQPQGVQEVQGGWAASQQSGPATPSLLLNGFCQIAL